MEGLKDGAAAMLEDRAAARAEYEAMIAEIWRDAFALYQMILKISSEIGDEFNSRHGPTAAEANDLPFFVLIRQHARACRIAEEVLVLMRGGFGQAAMTRWRALHEAAVVSAFVKKHGSEVAERYLLHANVESWKAIQEYQRVVGRLRQRGYEPYEDHEVREARETYGALLQRFGRSYGSAYGWANIALKQNPAVARLRGLSALEKDVELDHLRPHYRMASHPAHANPKSILFNPDLSEDLQALLTGPSPVGMADPGHAVCISLTNITGTLLTSKPGISAAVVLSALLQLTDDAGEAFLAASAAARQAQAPETENPASGIPVPPSRARTDRHCQRASGRARWCARPEQWQPSASRASPSAWKRKTAGSRPRPSRLTVCCRFGHRSGRSPPRPRSPGP